MKLEAFQDILNWLGSSHFLTYHSKLGATSLDQLAFAQITKNHYAAIEPMGESLFGKGVEGILVDP